jgi:hypothetical protein
MHLKKKINGGLLQCSIAARRSWGSVAPHGPYKIFASYNFFFLKKKNILGEPIHTQLLKALYKFKKKK